MQIPECLMLLLPEGNTILMTDVPYFYSPVSTKHHPMACTATQDLHFSALMACCANGLCHASLLASRPQYMPTPRSPSKPPCPPGKILSKVGLTCRNLSAALQAHLTGLCTIGKNGTSVQLQSLTYSLLPLSRLGTEQSCLLNGRLSLARHCSACSSPLQRSSPSWQHWLFAVVMLQVLGGRFGANRTYWLTQSAAKVAACPCSAVQSVETVLCSCFTRICVVGCGDFLSWRSARACSCCA